MKLIVAADEDEGIGRDGQIPWKIPEDMQRFKTLTMGGTVVMGRKTWESLPERFRPLHGRNNVVISSQLATVFVDPKYPMRGGTMMPVFAYGSLPEFIASWNDAPALYRPESGPAPAPWIIGGGQIYAEALRLGLVDEIYLTRVLDTFVCDVRWPGVPGGWRRKECILSRAGCTFERWVPPVNGTKLGAT